MIAKAIMRISAFMVSLPAMCFGDRAERGGGWVHPNGEKTMA